MNSYFSPEALEALQQAYEMQLTPEQQDLDAHTGLPTNVVSNTSPWHGSVDLWKYPDGKNKLEVSPIMYRGGDEDETEEDGEIYDEGNRETSDSDDDDTLTEEEVDALIQELLESDEDE